MCKAQEVWPEFGFGDDYQLRAQGPEVGADGECEIHRKVEDIFFAETLAGEFLTGVGGGGDKDFVSRKTVAHFVDQAAYREDFADRDGMHPNRGRGFVF